MSAHDYELINDQTHFYHSFNRSSFFERLAKWSRFFSYGFLIFHLVSILIEMLNPFSINPPDLFFHLLFLLLIWGSIELYSIPLEAIKDTCTLDYQKNWICRAQHRFFFKRVVVLASFNQIKSIGVSCRPEPLSRRLFSGSEKRFAIFMLDLNNQMISLSDYNLTLSEANEFVQNLFIRHLSGTQIIPGTPGFELVFDPQTTLLSSRPCKRSFLTVVDALIFPLFQAFLAFIGTAIILSSVVVLLGTTALSVFSTDLKIARQPVFQLLTSIGHEPEPVIELPPPAEPPPEPAVGINSSDFSFKPVTGNATDSAITIDLFAGRVIEGNNQAESASASLDSITENASQASAINTIAVPDESQTNQPVVESEPAALSPEEQYFKNNTAESQIKIAEKQIPTSENDGVVIPARILLPPVQNNSRKQIQQQPVLQPLESRIPDVEIAKILKPASKVESKIKPPVVEAIKTADSTAPSSSDKASEKTVIALSPEITNLVPGHGLPGAAIIGENLDKLKNMGKPVTEDESQILFRGITILKEPSAGKIKSIIITARNSAATGKMETTGGLYVGSNINDVISKFGPAQKFDAMPGLHYPQRGISFMPSYLNPGKVGAIQLYMPGGLPR